MADLKQYRCAIYTRVSSDAGLEQDFNSLHAQRDAAEAFIRSQANEGWQLVHQSYDDGGYSGGSLERPALKRLLQDIKNQSVNVIVVYKVDRLTRSLADFAKLVELFDQHSASFVSVTQAFNTTNSMGRLTLNVLLSFAQFEREVTSERIRDKIAASKKKGMWMGGPLPLGYCVQNRKLVIVPEEADIVRMIFRRYLELGSMLPLLEELNRNGIRTRERRLPSGRIIGGIPFMRGALTHLLHNRIYLGELNHRTVSYPGEHEAILDRQTFDDVQEQFGKNVQKPRRAQLQSGALLIGKLFDDRGNLMSPTHTRKEGAVYRYYQCRLLTDGRKSEAGSVQRVPAPSLEQTVLNTVRSHVRKAQSPSDLGQSDRDLLEQCLERVVIFQDHISLTMRWPTADPQVIKAPWVRPPAKAKREILLPHANPDKDSRPIKSEVRESVVRALALSRTWLIEMLAESQLTVEALARRERRTVRSVRMLLSLNYLAPEIVRALIGGKLPRGIGITKLVHLPTNWREQRELLGLTQT